VQAAVFEIGPRPFAAMIEKADVVVGLLDRLISCAMSDRAREIGNEIAGREKSKAVLPDVFLFHWID